MFQALLSDLLGPLLPFVAGFFGIAAVLGGLIFNARRSGIDRERIRTYEKQEETRRANQLLIDEARTAALRARSPAANPDGLRHDKYQRD